MTTPLERLRARVAATGATLCVGIDPHPSQLPDGLTADAGGVERFARGIIEATAEHAAAVKLNVAFFEALGSAGWQVLERIRADVPADVVCILDGKRGDVGTTAERYAEAIFGRLRADGTTVSPYLGEDAIEPFLGRGEQLVYVLARTSNPSAGRIQGLNVDGAPLHRHVAQWVAERWPGGRVGLVVGATAPEELADLRAAVPGPPFLVPGVGAQGGDLAAAAGACNGSWGPGLVAVSRSISGASRGSDWQIAAATAARGLRGALAEAVVHSNAIAAQAARNGGS